MLGTFLMCKLLFSIPEEILLEETSDKDCDVMPSNEPTTKNLDVITEIEEEETKDSKEVEQQRKPGMCFSFNVIFCGIYIDIWADRCFVNKACFFVTVLRQM